MKKKEIKIEKGATIECGNHLVHVGDHNTGDIAIVSKYTGSVAKFTDAGKKLKKVKRVFKAHICDDEKFYFNFMTEECIRNLIELLKK